MHPLVCCDETGSLSASEESSHNILNEENIGMGFPNAENDQNSKCRFLDESFDHHGNEGKDQVRRGRPRADVISVLIREGTTSQSRIRCETCSRVFPREKSLQAHMRTHTGERPYKCEYPGCGKAFRQSGQLKTHQRLHTGEKPFVCSVEGCETRFTHANRHCSIHPFASLKRIPSAESSPASRSSKPNHSSLQSTSSVHMRRPRPNFTRVTKAKRSPGQQPPPRPRKKQHRGVQVPREVTASVRRKLFAENSDELLSALALIELAQSPPSLSPQSPMGGSATPGSWRPMSTW